MQRFELHFKQNRLKKMNLWKPGTYSNNLKEISKKNWQPCLKKIWLTLTSKSSLKYLRHYNKNVIVVILVFVVEYKPTKKQVWLQ